MPSDKAPVEDRRDREVNTTQVLIVDDHPIVRQGIRRLIERQPDMEVCGEAGDTATALSILDRSPCDLAVIDLTLKGRSGFELIRMIRSRGYDFPVLVLSVHEEATYVEHALSAGAQGYLLKNEAPQNLILGLREILDGKIYLCETVSQILFSRLTGRGLGNVGEDPLAQLSDRELEVLEATGRGLSTRQIAERLSLSVSTIETHKARIKNKLSLKSAQELTAFAARWVGRKEQEPF